MNINTVLVVLTAFLTVGFGDENIKDTKLLSYHIDDGVGSFEEMAIMNSLRHIVYFLPWLRFETNKVCDLCFYGEQKPHQSTTNNLIKIDKCVEKKCDKLNFLGNIQRNIIIKLLDNPKPPQTVNSIRADDSQKYNYPIYYQDVIDVAQMHFGTHNYQRIIDKYDVFCKFIDTKHPVYDRRVMYERSGTNGLFMKYDARIFATSIHKSSVSSYDDFVFLHFYKLGFGIHCNDYHKRAQNISEKYAKTFEVCYAKFEKMHCSYDYNTKKPISILSPTTTQPTPLIVSTTPTSDDYDYSGDDEFETNILNDDETVERDMGTYNNQNSDDKYIDIKTNENKINTTYIDINENEVNATYITTDENEADHDLLNDDDYMITGSGDDESPPTPTPPTKGNISLLLSLLLIWCIFIGGPMTNNNNDSSNNNNNIVVPNNRTCSYQSNLLCALLGHTYHIFNSSIVINNYYNHVHL